MRHLILRPYGYFLSVFVLILFPQASQLRMTDCIEHDPIYVYYKREFVRDVIKFTLSRPSLLITTQ